MCISANMPASSPIGRSQRAPLQGVAAPRRAAAAVASLLVRIGPALGYHCAVTAPKENLWQKH